MNSQVEDPADRRNHISNLRKNIKGPPWKNVLFTQADKENMDSTRNTVQDIDNQVLAKNEKPAICTGQQIVQFNFHVLDEFW